MLSKSLLFPRFAALSSLFVLSLAGYQSTALSQQVFPELQDRTSEALDGLSNDDTAKIIEIGDFNSDGFEDLVISRTTTTPVLLINLNGVLTNSNTFFFPGEASASDALYVEGFDANGDGLTDLVFGMRNASPRLFLNLGNDASGDWLGYDGGNDIAGTSNNLVLEAGDVNGDGADDLFAIRVEFDTNDLLLNDGSGNFTAASSQLGGLGDLRRGHSALLEDVEGDGDEDIIYIESDLFLDIYYNDGDGNFDDTMRSTFRNPDNFAYIFGAGDFNGDGIFDYRQYSNPGPEAEMSDGTFDANGIPNYNIRTEPDMLRGNRKHGTVHIRDIDGDGDLDYVLSSILRNFGGLRNTTEGMRTEMVFNTGFNSGVFETFVGTDWGLEESFDMRIIDINNDGAMDMFVGHQFRYGAYINNAAASAVELADAVSAPPAEVSVATTIAVTLVSGTNVSYEWDFGDGTTVSSAQPSISHTYTTPGRYQVTVTANGSGGSDQNTFFQRVHEPLTNGLAVSSMDVIYQSRTDNDRVYVTNPDNDSVTVVDAVNGAVLGEIPVGDEPRSLTLDSNANLQVVNKGDASITTIDTNTLAVTASFDLPRASRPHGIVYDIASEFAFVALEATGRIAKLDFQTSQIVAELDVGSLPRELGLSADGSVLYAPRFITLPVAGESTRTPAADGGEITVVDPVAMLVTGSISVPYNQPPGGVDTEVNARGIPNYLRSPAISPNGLVAIVPAKSDNIYRGSMRDGQARTHDMLVRGILSKIDLTAGSEIISDRFQFDNNSQPTAVAFGPTGNFLFVVHEASRQFEVIDVYSNSIIFSDDVGFAPTGLTVSPDGGRVFIHNWLDRSLSIVDSSDLMAGVSDNADVINTVNLVTNDALSPRILEGKRLFFDSGDLRLSAQKYISCASCHDEVGHDGRTWDFSDAGEGLRNTIDLRGRAGIGNGNVHWSANFDEIHDFENDIREIFDGTGLLEDADFAQSAAPLNADTPKSGRSAALDALAAFTSTLTDFSQSPYRRANGELTAAAINGRTIFEDSGCAACHSGDHFTDSQQGLTHNIGTVDADTGGRLGMPLLNGGLDSPTLKGLWHGAPYLHDGSALTLQDAVLAHTSLANFSVESLSSSQLDDLADYLLQIDADEPAPVDNSIPEPPEPPQPPTTGASTVADINIGGGFSDWPDEAIVGTDPADVSGNNNTLDYAQASLAHNDVHLFVRFDNHAPDDVVLTWGYSMHIDVDGPASGYIGSNGELPLAVDYMVEARTLYRYTGSGQDWSWAAISTVPMHISGGAAEFAVLRQEIGNQQSFNTIFFANNRAVQGTAIDYFPDAASNAQASPAQRVIGYNFGGTAPPVVQPPTPSGAISNSGNGIVMDGSITDWSSLQSFATDPDDIAGGGVHIDWLEAWMAHTASDFYIAWRNDGATQSTWGNGIMLDADNDATTGFTGYSGELAIGIDFLIEETNLFSYTGTGSNWSWQSVGTIDQQMSGATAELRIPASVLGNPDTLNVIFIGNNAALGSTGIDYFPDASVDRNAPVGTRSFVYTTSAASQAVAVTLNGSLDEWPESTKFGDQDPNEMGATETIDWRQAYVTHNSENLFIAYEMYSTAILNWGYGVLIDVDDNASTGFSGFAGELAIGADFIIEGSVLARYTGSSQSEWSWNIEGPVGSAADSTSVELAIPRAVLGDPDSVRILFRGDNSAGGGNGIDTYPDTGNLEYDFPSLVSPQLDQPRAGDDENNSDFVLISSNETGVSGGSGTLSLTGLLSVLFIVVVARAQRVIAVARSMMPVSRITAAKKQVLCVIPVLALAACDSGGGKVTDGAGNLTSEGYPAASSAQSGPPLLGAGMSSDGNPQNNASFGSVFSATLSGLQMVPPVPTNASGNVELVINRVSGELSGTVGHSLDDVLGVSLHIGGAGEAGAMILPLELASPNGTLYRIPGGTLLSPEQIATLDAGGMNVQVQSVQFPAGELRAQLTAELLPVSIDSTLGALQTSVFAPKCSGCHIGVGSTLPGSMDLTNRTASFTNLVNVASVEVPGLLRVDPGSADSSYLVHKVEGAQSVGSQMPFRGDPLTAEELAAIRGWINEGAMP